MKSESGKQLRPESLRLSHRQPLMLQAEPAESEARAASELQASELQVYLECCDSGSQQKDLW